jgi:hypothetical protein
MSTDPHPQEILHNTVIRVDLGLDQFRTLVNDKIKIMMTISIKVNAYRLLDIYTPTCISLTWFQK